MRSAKSIHPDVWLNRATASYGEIRTEKLPGRRRRRKKERLEIGEWKTPWKLQGAGFKFISLLIVLGNQKQFKAQEFFK